MEKLNIFVVSHKPLDTTKYPGRKVIYVGTKHGQTPDFITIFTDNTKNNIAKLNPFYCEMTAIYWVWKNAPHSEYIGFEHYSRNFYHNCKMASLDYLYEKALKCDIIHAGKAWHFRTNKKFWTSKEGAPLFSILKDAIAKVEPTYLNEWLQIMDKHALSYCNMFICQWKTFDKLMKFMFKILDEAFVNIKHLSSEQQSRSIGYMAERLLDVFIKHNNYKDKSIFIRTKKH